MTLMQMFRKAVLRLAQRVHIVKNPKAGNAGAVAKHKRPPKRKRRR